jgi:hypothetical protein
MIAHLVLFTPRENLTAEEKRSLALAVQEAGRSIEAIRRAVVGRSVHIDAGYERELGVTAYQFAAVLEFDTPEGLLEYLHHPLHERLGRLFWDLCERSIVTEIETRDFAAEDVVKFLTE